MMPTRGRRPQLVALLLAAVLPLISAAHGTSMMTSPRPPPRPRSGVARLALTTPRLLALRARGGQSSSWPSGGWLEAVDEIQVQQKVEAVEVVTGIETRNRYKIQLVRNGICTQELRVVESSSFLQRVFLQTMRAFTLTITDSAGRPLLSLERPFKWYFHRLLVRDGSGQLLGTVKRRFSVLRKDFKVKDAHNNTIIHCTSPFWKPWTWDVVTASTEQPIGMIRKKLSTKVKNILREALTDADNFKVVVPAALPPEHKALLLANVFLIDFLYFENNEAASRGGLLGAVSRLNA